MRIDKLLVKRGLVAEREEAHTLIQENRVLVGGLPVASTQSLVDPAVAVQINALEKKYVSRGAYKLLAGLDAFEVDPTGATAIDVGASTGGFTDVLLERNAKRVYAVDVGYGILAWKLRKDPRVVIVERENIRHLALEKVPEPCDLAVVDVSFISLALVLPRVVQLLRPPGGKPIIVLVKPQFELAASEVGSGGVVRGEQARLQAVHNVCDWATRNGYGVGDYVASPIQGHAGNVEYLLLLRSPH